METEGCTPPEGLLARIVRQLGLEKQLLILRRHLSVVITVLLGTVIGAVCSVLAIRSMLFHSSFGPYTSLMRSDFGFIAGHATLYLSALIESAPSALMTLLLAALAVLLLCIRLTVVFVQRMGRLTKSIHHP